MNEINELGAKIALHEIFEDISHLIHISFTPRRQSLLMDKGGDMELAFECDLVWDDFEGRSDTRRHCGQCDQHVYNISNMTRAHAERVIELHRDKGICVHFVRRDGRVVHKGDPREQLRAQRSGIRRLLAVALIGHAGFLSLSDNPSENFFDPFAAAAEAIGQVDNAIDQKFEEANASVVSGGVMF